MDLNNRELAVLIYVAAVAAVVTAWPTGRRAVAPVARALFQRAIMGPLLLMLLYTGALVLLGLHLKLWDAKLATPTVIWFVTVAIVRFFRLSDGLNQRHYFRRMALETVSISTVVEFILGLFPFALGWELLLQAVFFILAALHAFMSRKQEYRDGLRALNWIIMALVLTVVVHTITQIVTTWTTFDTQGELRKFVLPIVLTAAVLPFIYCFTLYAAYEKATRHMRVTVPAEASIAPAVGGLLLRAGLTLRKVTSLAPSTRSAMARAKNLREAVRLFDEGAAGEAAAQRAVAAKERRFQELAGVKGVDADGHQLDQREFNETKRLLDYLSICHMGHYRKEGRYRTDLLDLFGPDTFVGKGLPPEPHINMTVAPDGQSWWAWRRTVTGWVFGIGALEAPNDRWEFDGPDVPSGGPGTHPAWRHFMVPAEPHEHW